MRNMNIKTLIGMAACFLTAGYSTAFAQKEIPMKNPGFEEEDKGWTFVDPGLSKIIPEAAHNGSANGLRVTDDDANSGSSVFSDPHEAKPGATYEVTFWGRYLRGEGMAVSIVFYDANKKILNSPVQKNENIVIISKGTTDWKQFKVEGVAPAGAATLRIWIHSFYADMPVADVDDVGLIEK